MDFEASAEVIENYEPQVVPDPLQTEDYARALLSCQEHLPKEHVEALVAARMSRQKRQRSNSARWAIIDESVLRQCVGSTEHMHKQLASLLAQADTPDSKVQVMPFSAGPHSLMSGALTLLTLPDDSAVAYEEGIQAGHLYEDRDTVKKWRRQYEVLRANSLSPADSAELIQKAMEDYKPCDSPRS